METSKISSSQGAQSANGAHKARSVSPDSASSAPQGFLALLAALGDAGSAMGGMSADEGSGTDPLLSDAPGAQDLQTCADMSALAAWQGLWTSQAPGMANAGASGATAGATLRTAGLEGATGGALPQAGIDAQGLWAAAGGALPGADGLPQGLVAETTTLDAAADIKAGALPIAGTGPSRSWGRMQGAMSQKADAAAGAAAPQRAGEPGSLPPLAALAAGTAALPLAGEAAAVGHAADAAAQRAGGTGRAEAADSAGAEALGSLWAAVASAGGGDAAGGSASSRPGDGPAGAGAWVDGAAGTGSIEPSAADDAAAFIDPSQATREEQLAEQVSYWINQKTQNAELTLQRDGQAVEVSVSLTGNEAHVAFRSDESHTRELLDRSMAQLSELLRSEGLVLSGMSVGTSASQGENAGNADRQGQSRQGTRQAQVVAAVPPGSGSLLRGIAPDRAVDVFV